VAASSFGAAFFKKGTALMTQRFVPPIVVPAGLLALLLLVVLLRHSVGA
jgi:hypothetical protein